MVVWVLPMPINSPLKETVEAGVPAQVIDEPLPLQPVPEAEQLVAVTTIFVKLPRVVENVPPSMRLPSLGSIKPAETVTPSFVKLVT